LFVSEGKSLLVNSCNLYSDDQTKDDGYIKWPRNIKRKEDLRTPKRREMDMMLRWILVKVGVRLWLEKGGTGERTREINTQAT
jgi:hypothetical protein